MKNLITMVLVLIGVLAFNTAGQAQNAGAAKTDALPGSERAKAAEDWDFFSFPFFPGVPSSCQNSDTYGAKVGLPISFGEGKVCGIETGALAATTDHVYGLQICPVLCMSKYVEGVQATIVNIAETVKGLQFGIFNYAEKEACQLGIINIIKDGYLPFTIIFNISK